MRVLFVHQNFPAQFKHIAPRLAADYGWDSTFVTARGDERSLPGVRKVVYRPAHLPADAGHACVRPFDTAAAHALGVFTALKNRPDVPPPDLVVAHSGFGSSLFLPHAYDAPVINFFEYYFHPVGQELGYRPDERVSEQRLLRSRVRNGMLLLDLANCERGWCPSRYQRDLFPPEFHDKIEVIPEGIDTNLWRRREVPDRVLPDGTRLAPETRLVTYVSRGFEMMRGFDVFMRAADRIARQFPDVVFAVVGTDRVCYGGDHELTGGGSFREYVLGRGDFDLSKFHFTGHLPEQGLADLLSISDLHVYLTVPFVTSWSMLDAMSCSCVVLASDQKCVREYIRNGENGLLCDFFDAEGIASQAVQVLRDPPAYGPLAEAARRTIEQDYALDLSLPRIKSFFEDVAGRGPRRPSLRADLIARPGLQPASTNGPPGKPSGRELPPFDAALPFHVDGNGPPSRAPDVRLGVFAGGAPIRPPGLGRGGAINRRKTILFVWELGAGLGHLTQMLQLAQALVKQGHSVFVAMRHVEGADAVFCGTGVFYLPVPFRTDRPHASQPFPITLNFAHLLANVGWADDRELSGLASTWRNLFRMIKPDLIVFDHSPTALLAARGLPVRRALIGSGFCVPPDVSPWPLFRPEIAGRVDPAALRADEDRVLDRANRLLRQWGWRPLERLGQLYGEADENFLTTFPELDAVPSRRGAGYWGPVFGGAANGSHGQSPTWPADGGVGGRKKQILAYLKPFPGLPDVLDALDRTGHPTLAYVADLEPGLRKRFQSSPTLRLVDRPLDLTALAGQCDLAVLNSGHGATTQMLLAGTPILGLPIYLEQRLTAAAVMRLGAGEEVATDDAGAFRSTLDSMLADGRYAQAARRFADRYAKFDPKRQRDAMLARAEELLAGGAGAAAAGVGAA